MSLVSIRKLFLPAILLAAFLGPLLLAPIVHAAPSRSDCNSTSNPTQCKKEYDKCKNNACRQQAIDDYKGKIGLDCGVSADKGGGCIASKAASDEGYQCGADDANHVNTKFNFGCLGSNAPSGMGSIQDLLFALIRFASVGVGIAVTIALIAAGIQYSTAEGNPESSQKAKLRAQNALIALAIYIFAFSALQYLIPGGIFNK